jgi:hypothetical protein
MITTEDKLNCIQRELRLRQRVYPRLINNGKMSEQQAEHELLVMQAVLQDYQAVASQELLL